MKHTYLGRFFIEHLSVGIVKDPFQPHTHHKNYVREVVNIILVVNLNYPRETFDIYRLSETTESLFYVKSVIGFKNERIWLWILYWWRFSFLLCHWLVTFRKLKSARGRQARESETTHYVLQGLALHRHPHPALRITSVLPRRRTTIPNENPSKPRKKVENQVEYQSKRVH